MASRLVLNMMLRRRVEPIFLRYMLYSTRMPGTYTRSEVYTWEVRYIYGVVGGMERHRASWIIVNEGHVLTPVSQCLWLFCHRPIPACCLLATVLKDHVRHSEECT